MSKRRIETSAPSLAGFDPALVAKVVAALTSPPATETAPAATPAVNATPGAIKLELPKRPDDAAPAKKRSDFEPAKVRMVRFYGVVNCDASGAFNLIEYEHLDPDFAGDNPYYCVLRHTPPPIGTVFELPAKQSGRDTMSKARARRWAFALDLINKQNPKGLA